MTELKFDYSIRSEMPPRQESPDQLGARFVSTLDALTHVEPTIFANWEVMDYPAMASSPLAEACEHIADIIEKMSITTIWGNPARNTDTPGRTGDCPR